MSIEVVSNEKSAPQTPAAAQAAAGNQAAAQSSDSTSSAPPANEAGEQNTGAQESETSGKGAVESETEVEQEVSDDQGPRDGEDSETDAKNKSKKKSGIQRRVDKLNARISAAQQEAEFWKQQALKGANESKPEAKIDSKPVAAEGKPDPDKFTTHAEYVEALADWKTEQKLNERDRKAEQVRLQDEQAKLSKSYSERKEAFAAKTEDFDEVMEEVSDIRVSPTLSHLLVSSEDGPEISYELAKNRAELERINRLSPIAAAVEIGKIQYRIASKASEGKKTETNKISKAPNPITPVGGSGKATASKTLEEAAQTDFKAYKRMREEELKRRRA